MYVDPIFQARMPDAYYRPLNYGTNGVLPEAAGWNVNSAYLTPTFMAGYRPQYSGPQNMQMPYMGFWRGANTALPTPFQPDTPYYVDPRQYREHALTSSTNKAMDLAMTGAQLATGILVSSWVGNLASRNLTGTSAGFGQMIRGENALGRLGAGVGRGFGAMAGSLTAGAGRIAGTISPWGGAAIAEGAAALGMGVMRAGAVVGGAVGGLALPFAVGVGAAEMLDRATFRPYLAGRQSADVLRSQYAGMAIGAGTAHSPLGMSNAESNRMGFAVSSAFGGRLDFNDMSAPQFLQFGMQEGLYKNLNKVNASTITSRTKELAEQVKMVMDVFNEPSMQDAIKELGRLMNAGGVTGTSGVASLLGKYKLTSAMTGISTRELAGTIGIQGQMMYGQAGLVPALGQAVGLSSMRGIDAAFRSGLVGADIMAMLGGRQGMVQGTQQGLLGLSQSTYNKIMAYNQYALGGAGGNIVSNLTTFGADIAKDPLGAYGRFALNANKAVSAQMKNDPFAPIQQSLQLLDTLPGAKNDRGQYRAEVVYSALLQQGLDPQSAESLLRTIQGYGAPGYMDRLRESNRGIQISNREKFLEQNALLYHGTALGRGYYNVRSGLAGMSQYMGEAWGGFATNMGGLTDAFSGALLGMGGAAEATGLYDVDPTDATFQDFMTKKKSRTGIAASRKISMGGMTSGGVNVGSTLAGGAAWAAGAVLSGTGIGAVVGVPLMIAGAGAIASGAYGYNPAAAQRLEKLYAAADADSSGKLRGILDKARGGGALSTSERAYLMTKSGETTSSGLNDLITDLGNATVSEKGVGGKVELSDYEAAKDNFTKQLREGLGEVNGLTESDAASPTNWAIRKVGTREQATSLSDTLGMQASASLGKILQEISQGAYDESGTYVGAGKGVTKSTDDEIREFLGTVLGASATWRETLRKNGLNPENAADIQKLFAIGKSSLARTPREVAAAGRDPNDPNFEMRYQKVLSGFKAAGMKDFVSSGESKMAVTQLAAIQEGNIAQVEDAIASKKSVGLEGKFDWAAMMESTAKTNKEAIDKFDLAVEKFRRPWTSEETIKKEMGLAAPGTNK